jgi:Holliday junction resolvase
MPRIIVFHVAWMEKYNGDVASLNPGGFQFDEEFDEVYNFRNIVGRYYGYVPPTGDLHFENHYDVEGKPLSLDHMTVIWTAPHPEQGGRAVVGIWRDATVYRQAQESSASVGRRRRNGTHIAGFRSTAEAKNCTLLLPFDKRPIFVAPGQDRGGESWPGQQKVFYPKPGSPALARLLEIIDGGGPSPAGAAKRTGGGRSGWQADVERRKKIETAAILAVGRHLEEAGFEVTSKEKESLGYDLLAMRGKEVLQVEVKGRSGKEICAELTVNEFDCMTRYQRNKKARECYRVAIVVDALAKPLLHQFVFLREAKEWRTLDGTFRLLVEKRHAARLTAERVGK